MSAPAFRPARRAARVAPLLALAAVAAPLHAQRSPLPAAAPATGISITPYAGVMRFGDYLDGPLGTRLSGGVAPVGGVQLAIPVARGISLVGNVAYSSGDLDAGVPILGGIRVGSSRSWLYDAGLEFRLPSTSSVAPFLQAGAGAIDTRLSSGPLNTSATNAAVNVGGGFDLSLGRSLGVRLQVRDYVGRFDAGEVAGMRVRGDVSHNLAASAGVRLAF